jgi:hypothetical protein
MLFDPDELEEGASLETPLLKAVDEMEAHPIEPPDVERVAGVHEVPKHGILFVGFVEPLAGLSDELSLVLDQTVGSDHPDISEHGVLGWVDPTEANRLP